MFRGLIYSNKAYLKILFYFRVYIYKFKNIHYGMPRMVFEYINA